MIDEPRNDRVQEAHLFLSGHGDKILKALLERLHRFLHDLGDIVGKRAVQILRHRLNQRGLLLLINRDLRQRINAQHARIAAKRAVKRLDRILRRAVNRAGNHRKQHRADHAENRGHKSVFHAGNQRCDRILNRIKVRHVKARQTARQTDQRAQKSERNQQARHRVGKCRAPGTVNHRILIDEILDIAGVVIHAVGEEEIVHVSAPVRKQGSPAEEIILLPRALGFVARAQVANRAPETVSRIDNRRDAQEQPHYKHHDDDRIHHNIRKAARTEHR